jgi:hypothetical protein
MTKKQWRLLDILEDWGGTGTIEVVMQWGEYECDDDPHSIKGFKLAEFVVAAVMRTLVKKGYAVNDADGYGITEAGKAALERHREQSAARKQK